MVSNNQKTARNSVYNRRVQDRQNYLNSIVKKVEKGTGLSVAELKKKYSEETLFTVALKHVTTTKKALCKALNLNIDNACRYKRRKEKDGLLVQSVDEVICRYSKHSAHLISTNPKEFEKLTHTNQLSL